MDADVQNQDRLHEEADSRRGGNGNSDETPARAFSADTSGEASPPNIQEAQPEVQVPAVGDRTNAPPNAQAIDKAPGGADEGALDHSGCEHEEGNKAAIQPTSDTGPTSSDGVSVEGRDDPSDSDFMPVGADAPERIEDERIEDTQPANESRPKLESEALPEAHKEGSAEPSTPQPPETSFADDGDELEEVLLDPQSEDNSLKPGMIHLMGDVHYVVKECLPWGYYRGHDELDETTSVLFHLAPLSPRDCWQKLGTGHRMLPRILYDEDDGHVLDDIEGVPVDTGLSLQEALQVLNGIRQLMRFLSVRCQAAVTGICMEGLVWTEDHGVRVRYLPTLVPIGEPAHVNWTDRITPIEGSETSSASEQTSIFLWGVMLHGLVTGEPLSTAGLDLHTLAQLRVPGLPQLLATTLDQQHPCPDLSTLRNICQDFMAPPVPRYLIGAATTVGLNPDRLCNEDSYGFVFTQCEYHDSRPQLIRACVADGMGGEAAGEVASKAAVDAFCHAPAPSDMTEAEEQIRWTRDLGWNANRAVVEALADSGGGCTLTGVVVQGDRLTLAHVGDSRAYLHSRDHGLQLLSRDHSQVKALLDSGMLTEDGAANYEHTNQILRALGERQSLLAEEYVDTLGGLQNAQGESVHDETLSLQVEDLVLLMSDGVWGSWEYRESVISAALAQVIIEADREPQAVADALVQVALDAGADDNATIVVLKRVA